MSEFKHQYLAMYIEKDGRFEVLPSRTSALTWGLMCVLLWIVLSCVTFGLARFVDDRVGMLHYVAAQCASGLAVFLVMVWSHFHYKKKMRAPGAID